MLSYPIIGKKTIYIDDEVISPEFVQDEAATITLTPATTEVATQAGTFNIPNGSYEEMSFEINIIVPSVRFLGMLFPELWHNAKFQRVIAGEYSETGQVRFGAAECISNTPRRIIIHNVCDGASSAQDITLPNCMISAGGEFTVSISDPFKVTLSGSMLPGSEGAVVFGEQDLETPSYFNEETGQVEASEIKAKTIAASPSSISGKVGDKIDVTLTVSPNGATDTVTLEPTGTNASAALKGGNVWTVTLSTQGSETLTAKAGEASTTINCTISE